MLKTKAALLVILASSLGVSIPAGAFENLPIAVKDLDDGSYFSKQDTTVFMRYASADFRKRLAASGKAFEVHNRDEEYKQLEKDPSLKLKSCELVVLGTLMINQPRKKRTDAYMEKKADEAVQAAVAKKSKKIVVDKGELAKANEGKPDTPAEISLDVRLVDLRSGEIVDATSGSAVAKDMQQLEIPTSAEQLKSKAFSRSALAQMWDVAVTAVVQQLDASAKSKSRLSDYVANIKSRRQSIQGQPADASVDIEAK